MTPSTFAFASVSVVDLARVSGGADAQGDGMDPSQLSAGTPGSQAPAADGAGLLGGAFATLIQNAAAGFGASFGGQLGTMTAQLIGRLLPAGATQSA